MELPKERDRGGERKSDIEKRREMGGGEERRVREEREIYINSLQGAIVEHFSR